MVDWSANALNHKYWVQIALLQSLGRPFSFCDTTTTTTTDAADAGKGSADAVYAQGLTSAKGRLLVLINTKATPQTVTVTGASGKHAAVIDSAVGNEAAREVTLAADAIELGAFGERDRGRPLSLRCVFTAEGAVLCVAATMLVHWANATKISRHQLVEVTASFGRAHGSPSHEAVEAAVEEVVAEATGARVVASVLPDEAPHHFRRLCGRRLQEGGAVTLTVRACSSRCVFRLKAEAASALADLYRDYVWRAWLGQLCSSSGDHQRD